MKKALLIGIDYLNNNELKLYGCLNDIMGIANMLIDAFDYDKKNVIMLRDDSRNEKNIPNKENIIRELHNVVDTEEDDEIWIHFSGHGTYQDDENYDEKDFYDEIIIPVDYQENGVIKDEELLRIIKKSKCKTMITFDCCNSGSICDLPWRFEYLNENFYKYKENDNELVNKNICMITSCRDNQLAVDGWSDDLRLGYGAMTEAFLECLRFNHFNVSIFKLLKDISIYMKQINRKQITTLSSSSEKPEFELKRPVQHRKNDEIYDIKLYKNYKD